MRRSWRVSNPLIRKLELFSAFSDREKRALERLSLDPRSYRAGEDLIQEGQRPNSVFLLIEGWACAYKMLPDGSRQIMAYLLPGDTGDIFNFVVDAMSHSISALSACRVVAMPQAELHEVIAEYPAIAKALFWTTQVDGATLREWLLNVGQRDGMARAAHLFTELALRMGSIGLAANDGFALPLTQTDMADTMGLTPVYVNRMLQQMRGDGLITLERRRLTIHEPERLSAMGAFTPGYLHMNRTSRAASATA